MTAAASIPPDLQYTAVHGLQAAGWFRTPGAYVLVDGQYGSTGKGLMASVLAGAGQGLVSHVTTNAGPNSGHTAYVANEKVMTQQLPISSIALAAAGWEVLTHLNAGAIIDPTILRTEQAKYGLKHLSVHPAAAIIRNEDRIAESIPESGAAKVASTAKGVGAALAAKVRREGNVAEGLLPPSTLQRISWNWFADRVLVEVSQGYSLGINSRFHPHTTSRECTVMQAIADAAIPPGRVKRVCATYRTFPIRVGHTDVGNSGGCYPDQQETTWEAIGQEPELTSVTKRVRRVFTWSREQFRESVAANEPDTIFINFANYLDTSHDLMAFMDQVLKDYRQVMTMSPRLVLIGLGPRPSDVHVWA